MRFVTFSEAADRIRGKSIAIVGSAPSCVTDNKPGFVDSHEVVLRINNHKCGPAQGSRTDIHYSFYGSSIRNNPADLKRQGVKLSWCKCPNSKPLESAWHESRKKTSGIDFRYIYEARRRWWFCDTFIPDDERFMRKVNALYGHIPSTGLSAIMDVIDCKPASIYVTGFDFFSSGIHNVNELWRPGDPTDPIGHVPELERSWIAREGSGLELDKHLKRIIADERARMEAVA